MAENNTNRTVMMLAGAVVVLLIAFVAVVMLNTGSAATPTAQAPAATTGTGTATDASSTSSFTKSVGAFDPATATKVPAKEDPKAYMTRFFQDILDGKWAEAEKMQPAASVTGDAAGFQSTWQSYGIKGFSIYSATASSTDATVVVRLDLGANGIWNTAWTFVKGDDSWLVKERAKIAMGEPTK